MKNIMIVQIGYNTLALVGLTPAEIGQISQILMKSESVSREYLEGKIVYVKCSDDQIQTSLVDSSYVIDKPEPPAAENE